jgi:hypothetical protein
MSLFKPAAVKFTEKQVHFINEAAREAVEYVANRESAKNPLIKSSPRTVQRCYQIAASMTLPLYFSAKTLGEWNGYRVIAASDEAISRAVAFMLEDIAQKNGIRPEELSRYVIAMISRELA